MSTQTNAIKERTESKITHNNIVLYGGPTSPFARMARVVGEELGLVFHAETVDVYNAEFLDNFNPLRQIPTLVINGERAVFDSRTIFTYFDQISDQPSILPNTDIGHATRVSLLLGMTEACLQYRMESILPDGERSDKVIEKLLVRLNRCLDHLETIADQIVSGSLRLEHVVAACTLEYIDYRYSKRWRKRCPKLDAWSRTYSLRDSMLNSRPKD